MRIIGSLCLFLLCGVAQLVPAQEALLSQERASESKTAGQQQPSAPLTSISISKAEDEESYRIGPGDVLNVVIVNRPNLSRENVRVEGDGTIRMPLIDSDIRAACRTERELAKTVSAAYLKFYRNPQVVVFIKEYNSKPVAVIGAVTEQGRFQMQRRVRLLELLAFAKGLTDKAGRTVNIIHTSPALVCEEADGKSTEEATEGSFVSYNLSDTLKGDDKANPFVRPGDIITIPEADQVYVTGSVYTPKTIPLKYPITVSQAVAMAGGVGQDAKTDRVRILRQTAGATTRSEIFVDLKAIRSKRAEDLVLQPNDIVDVPTSAGKSILRSLIGTIAPAVSQLPVRVIP